MHYEHGEEESHMMNKRVLDFREDYSDGHSFLSKNGLSTLANFNSQNLTVDDGGGGSDQPFSQSSTMSFKPTTNAKSNKRKLPTSQ
jgi:hypothetical protein